jgi:hypothetical protein
MSWESRVEELLARTFLREFLTLLRLLHSRATSKAVNSVCFAANWMAVLMYSVSAGCLGALVSSRESEM